MTSGARRIERPPSEPGGALLATALSAAVAAARGPASRRWLADCAGAAEVPEVAPASGADADEILDAVADSTWRGLSRADRRSLGQVFTPRPVARQVLLELGDPPDGAILDPACGAGVFLAEAAGLRAERRRAEGWSAARVARDLLASIVGVDLDPAAARLARLVLGQRVLTELGDAAEAVAPDLPLPSVRCGDATEPDTLLGLPRPDWVVGNPPYREAKGMGAAARGRLRARFGDRLGGAFDVYLAFVWLALELIPEDGRVGLVLPNKLLVARYAAGLRRRLLAERRLHALIDLSELDVFGRVGVYPVIVALGPPKPTFRATFGVSTASGLGRAALPGVPIEAALAERVSDPPVWFTLPDSPLHGLIARLLGEDGRAPRLRDLAEVRSTCSFHARGLRERYVRPGEELPGGLPYLGGLSYARRNEVRPFRVAWQGFRIDYDQVGLRALGNPLPPLARFQRPKAVLCQHARRAIAWLDEDGAFVTKDVYPIVLPRDGAADTAAALVGLLNSRVVSVLYHLLYRGIAIGGGYLHFLPVFLHAVPIPRLAATRVAGLAARVRALQASPEVTAFEALDREVAELYGLSAAEGDAVRRFADERLGFAPDPLHG
jgi:hypothetical protein